MRKIKIRTAKINEDFFQWLSKIDMEKIKKGTNKTGKLYGVNKITSKILKAENLPKIEQELINKEFNFEDG